MIDWLRELRNPSAAKSQSASFASRLHSSQMLSKLETSGGVANSGEFSRSIKDRRSKTNINVLRIRPPAFGSEGLAYNDAHGHRAPVGAGPERSLSRTKGASPQCIFHPAIVAPGERFT